MTDQVLDNLCDHKNLQSSVSNNKCLSLLLKKCKKYTKNERYVYKICRDVSSKKDKNNEKWLIVMKKLKDTQTNEARSTVVDMNHAKYRANKLKVIKIFNKNSPNLIKQFVVNEFDGITLRYTVGKIVEPNKYDENIETVCSNGVHYFKTLDAAYYYGDIQNYTGYWISWHDNGQKWSEGNYMDDQKVGRWIKWYPNGYISEDCEYIKGKTSGHYIKWHDNKHKFSDGEYINGNMTGHWTNWHYNGQKSSEGNYVNGYKSGYWIHWHENGRKFNEGCYVNGNEFGHWMHWHDNGLLSGKGKYDVNGNESGYWTYWHYDGQKASEGYYVNGRIKANLWTR